MLIYVLEIYRALLKVKFKLSSLLVFKANYYIIDIDNTIADTWPTLKSIDNEYLRYKNLFGFQKMISYLKTKKLEKNVHFVFLSARNPRHYFVTKKWLKNQGFTSVNLILVPSPHDKLEIIKLIPKRKSIFIYDDLSYNHENGEIKFYSEIINELKDMKNVCYYDYEFLKKYQN